MLLPVQELPVSSNAASAPVSHAVARDMAAATLRSDAYPSVSRPLPDNVGWRPDHKPMPARDMLDPSIAAQTPEFDPRELRTSLEHAAAVIDDEIKTLEDATTVTREALLIEFTI